MTTLTPSPRDIHVPVAPASRPSAKLAAKLAQISAAVETVQRDGTNTHFNYNYATAEAVFEAVRGAVAAAGVAITTEIAGPLDTVRELRGQNSTRYLVRLPVAITLTDSESGDALRVHWIGEAADAESSAIAKALTNALRTFLRTQFLIPQAADEDRDAQRGRGGQRGRGRARNGQAARAADPKALTPELYQQLNETFQAAGAPVDQFAAWLDEHGHDPSEGIIPAVLAMSQPEGQEALKFLRGLGEPVDAAQQPAEAEATT